MSIKQTRSLEESQLIILIIQKRDDVRLKQNGGCGHDGTINLKYIFETKQ